MALGFNVSARNAFLATIASLVDAGTGAGQLRLYSGTRPATGAAITTQTLLATLTFSDPAFSAPSNGSMTANSIGSDLSADASGTATWFRIVNSDGTFVADGNVGVFGSGADLELSTNVISAGGSVSLVQATLNAGNA